jgi:hypothetical protein
MPTKLLLAFLLFLPASFAGAVNMTSDRLLGDLSWEFASEMPEDPAEFAKLLAERSRLAGASQLPGDFHQVIAARSVVVIYIGGGYDAEGRWVSRTETLVLEVPARRITIGEILQGVHRAFSASGRDMTDQYFEGFIPMSLDSPQEVAVLWMTIGS